MNERYTLINKRNALMKIIEAERAENKKYGIKYLSRNSYKILNKIWNIDARIMELT